MKKFAVIFLAALTALLSGCAYSGRTCSRPAPFGIIPMHIVLSFPYNPEDPNHDYHADGYYLWEETENWIKEDWDAYFEKYPDEYENYINKETGEPYKWDEPSSSNSTQSQDTPPEKPEDDYDDPPEQSDIDYDPPESVDVQVPTEGKTAIPD